MTHDYEAERLESYYGKPPDPPSGWVPFDPWTRKGDKHGPGKLILTVRQIRKPWFKILAKALWNSGRAYLIPWIWKACNELGEEEALKAIGTLENHKRAAAPSGSSVEPAPGDKSPSPTSPRESGNLSQRLLKGMKPTAAAKNAPED